MPIPVAYLPKRLYNGIQSNGVGNDLSKVLPYVDINSGTRNRIVTRDPISGLGNLPPECSVIPGSCKTRIPRPVKAYKSRITDHNTSPSREERCSRTVRRYERNPLTSKGMGSTVDDFLRARARSRNRDFADPVRDPIAGLGEFRTEWDPIYQYQNSPRRAKSVHAMNRNPIVNDETEAPVTTIPRKSNDPRNPITGQNVKSFNLSSEDKNYSPSLKRESRNVVTGENCNYYVVTMETDKHSKPRTNRSLSGNPLSGENCNTFIYTKEAKHIKSQPFKPSNPMTCENVLTYDLYPKQNKRSPKVALRCNPLTGENKQSLDEHSGYFSWRALSNSSRNAITGQNCDTFSINTELRSERSQNSSLAVSRSRSCTNLFFQDEM